MGLLLLEGGCLPKSGTVEGFGAVSGSRPDLGPLGVLSPSCLESGGRPLRKKGKTATPVTYVLPEAPDSLLEALRSASIDEEHRTIMSEVIQKVQSAKSGLTEACASLLIGFELSVLKCSRNITA